MRTLLNQNPLFYAFVFPAIVDGLITLVGQSNSYWLGEKVVNEASPAYYFLLISPWVYLVGAVLWFIFWYRIFKVLKEPFNFVIMFLFIAAHSWGSGGWIKKLLSDSGWYTLDNQLKTFLGWGLIITYFLLVAIFAAYCLKLYLDNRRTKTSLL